MRKALAFSATTVAVAVIATIAITSIAPAPIVQSAAAASSTTANYKYGWMTGQLPGTEIVAANVVREPAFAGVKDEQAQAMDKAKKALESDYCEQRGGEFVADPGLIVFDKGINEWMVGGICR
jgi:putative hemolysin